MPRFDLYRVPERRAPPPKWRAVGGTLWMFLTGAALFWVWAQFVG